MRGLPCSVICIALLYPIQDSRADSVFRCEDASGHITFTRHGCQTEQIQQIQSTRNQPPGGGKDTPARPKQTQPKENENSGIIIVGQQNDGCGNRITGSERRQAIIRQEVRSGMTRADVESSLGKPDRITRQNGQQRYHYRDKRGDSQQVTFDEAGCVKGK